MRVGESLNDGILGEILDVSLFAAPAACRAAQEREFVFDPPSEIRMLELAIGAASIGRFPAIGGRRVGLDGYE
jgi:hypothetical protein